MRCKGHLYSHGGIVAKLIHVWRETLSQKTGVQPTDVLEWRAVIQEMQHFLAADSLVPRSLEAGRHALTLQVSHPATFLESCVHGQNVSHVCLSPLCEQGTSLLPGRQSIVL